MAEKAAQHKHPGRGPSPRNVVPGSLAQSHLRWEALAHVWQGKLPEGLLEPGTKKRIARTIFDALDTTTRPGGLNSTSPPLWAITLCSRPESDFMSVVTLLLNMLPVPEDLRSFSESVAMRMAEILLSAHSRPGHLSTGTNIILRNQNPV